MKEKKYFKVSLTGQNEQDGQISQKVKICVEF